jgi:hypothetical protein
VIQQGEHHNVPDLIRSWRVCLNMLPKHSLMRLSDLWFDVSKQGLARVYNDIKELTVSLESG